MLPERSIGIACWVCAAHNCIMESTARKWLANQCDARAAARLDQRHQQNGVTHVKIKHTLMIELPTALVK